MVKVGDSVRIVYIDPLNGLPTELLDTIQTVDSVSGENIYITDVEEDGETWYVLKREYIIESEEDLKAYQEKKLKEAEESAKAFETIKLVLDKTFPDRYDIQGNDVLLYFPEIRTTNSKGNTWDHKDIFIRLEFQEGKLRSVKGSRSTYSYIEYIKQYRHPHISPEEGVNFDSCCFGSGPIQHAFNELRLRYSEITFEAFLFCLIEWLQWESLEGGPYVKTASLTNNSQRPDLLGNMTLEAYYAKFVNLVPEFPLILRADSDKNEYQVPNNEKFERLVLSITDEKDLCVKSSDGYFKKGTTKNGKEEIDQINLRAKEEDTYIDFKGEKFYLTVTDQITEEQVNELWPNPQITEYIRNKLQNQLNEEEYKQVPEEIT